MRRKSLIAILLIVLAAAACWQWQRLRLSPKTPSIHPPTLVPPPEVWAAQWPAFKNGGALQSQAVAAFPLWKMRLRWERKLSQETEGSPIVANSMVYLGADNGVCALSLASGAIKWTFKTEARVPVAPLFFSGSVFAGDEDGVFHALSAKDGAKQWEFKAEGPVHSPSNYAATPQGANLLFRTDYNSVYCVTAEKGRQAWGFNAGRYLKAGLAIAAGLVLFGGCDQTLHAVELQTGEEKWAAHLGSPVLASAVCDTERAFAATREGEVACFKLADGTEVWRRRIENEGFNGSPSLAKGILILPGQRAAAMALDAASGNTLWTFEARDGFDAPPAISGEGVYLPGNDGKLHVLNLQDGREVWSYTAGEPLGSSPALAEGCVVFCDKSGVVYCLSYGEPPR